MSEQRKGSRPLRGANISIYIDHEKLLCLDALAETTGQTRSILIQYVLESALEEMVIIERIDIIRVCFAVSTLNKIWSSTLDVVQGRIDRGKKKRNCRGVNISVWLKQDLIDDLEKLAPDLDLSRSKLIDMILEMRLRDVKSFTEKRALSRDIFPGILKSMLRQSWRNTFVSCDQAMKEGEVSIRHIPFIQ
ncbi:MAG TPA: hypothetical protein ENN05_05465 [Deltaproteobacteria bacterium]|mgnify:CR=1 FL=1|nr:hypothetical protein [Deltaproteobacteria bacterium]